MLNFRVCLILSSLALLKGASSETSNGVRPSNILGGAEQHASFSFVRPGLTQTAFAFNGPSSHQAFSSSVGDPQLAQRVLPGVANALAYRNPGLGYFGNGHVITQAYASAPPGYHHQPQQLDYHQQLQAYQQQVQYQQQQQAYSGLNQQEAAQQAHLAQILASNRFAPQTVVPEQIQLQRQQVQQQEQQNLLGVAYSAAPSVAHVKVSGNGYKIDF